ncbi:hypothetical protein AADZ91_08390 [Colwelliaceae bacterium 6441]
MNKISKWLVTLMLLNSLVAQASLIEYTSQSDFLTAISGMDSQTLNFDNQNAGDTIASGSSLGSLVFNYDFDGLDMIISDEFITSSGNNYLGIDDGTDQAFFSGDSFIINFYSSINALGLFIVSIDEIFAGDFTLTTTSGIVINSATSVTTLSDGANVYFLGLTDNEGFNSVSFSSLGCDCFFFNIDDITTASITTSGSPTEIPEPASWSLLILAMLAPLYRHLRQTH